MKSWLIKKLGGFPTVEDAIEDIRLRDNIEKYKILTIAVKKLFNTLSKDDILKEKDRQWFFMDKALDSGLQNLLIAEAKQLIDSKLWQVLEADIKYQANKLMFLDAKSEMDIVAGKLWLYTLDVINTRLKSLDKEKGIYNINK